MATYEQKPPTLVEELVEFETTWYGMKVKLFEKLVHGDKTVSYNCRPTCSSDQRRNR